MTLIIPYTFKGGQSAKAQEVNANFSQIAGYITDLEARYDNYDQAILALETGKANINGSPSNVFSVANPTEGYHAVNYTYMNNSINWLGYLIAGLKVSIISNEAGDNRFSVGLGGCGNNENQYIIQNNATYTTGNWSPLVSNFSYGVWVIGQINKENNLISKHVYLTRVALTGGGNKPTLAGNEVCRCIATITTDSNGNFASVTKEAY